MPPTSNAGSTRLPGVSWQGDGWNLVREDAFIVPEVVAKQVLTVALCAHEEAWWNNGRGTDTHTFVVAPENRAEHRTGIMQSRKRGRSAKVSSGAEDGEIIGFQCVCTRYVHVGAHLHRCRWKAGQVCAIFHSLVWYGIFLCVFEFVAVAAGVADKLVRLAPSECMCVCVLRFYLLTNMEAALALATGAKSGQRRWKLSKSD